jgi:hypothetical protein
MEGKKVPVINGAKNGTHEKQLQRKKTSIE